MLSNALRATLLAGTLSLLALVGGPIASASAEVESSQITSPADPSYVLYDQTKESSKSIVFTITGTTTGAGNVDVRCYYEGEENGYRPIAKEVEPSSNSFTVKVEASTLDTGQPCVLRAVPAGDKTPHPPGEAADPFKGPRLAASEFSLRKNAITEAPYDYELISNDLSGYLDFQSVGSCGLEYSNLVAPSTLEESEGLFDCNAALYGENHPPSGPSTRSELQIDGANAYSPATADSLAEKTFKLKASIPGTPQITVTKTFNEATGLVTINEIDPIVKCTPATTLPSTTSSCKEFVSTGVELERAWQASNAGQVAWMTDTWRSTDGAAHSLNALYDQTTVSDSKEGGAYEFPGTNVFSGTSKGQTVTLPPGLGRIYYKEDAATPGEGDGKHPQGAIVYDTPPSGPVAVYRGTKETKEESKNGFEMPYQATIPAGGSYTLNMAFVQAYKLSEVESLASEVLAKYPPSSPPTLSIASPASGATVSTPNVTVSGTVTDTRVITSFTVDGQAVSVGAGGAWLTSVPLIQGPNTIKAVATDQAGFSTEKTVSVTYTPIPPVAHASQVGSASGANGQVRFTIVCNGSAGASCEVEATLTTVEKFRHGKLVAVSARRHHPRTRSQRIVVGSSKLTIPAGQRVTIAIQLDSVGKSLLARFGRLPVHLTVIQISPTRRSTVIVQNLTVKPHKVRHKRRHHHRR